MRDFYIPEEKYGDFMGRTVLPTLSAHREEGYFAGYDGKELHYVAYRADTPGKTVLISHGFTESAEKFHELSYYLLHCGFSVFIPEHRGHGNSFREVEDLTLTHIDSFSEYVRDFALAVKKAKAIFPGECSIFAHSMGGAIALLYLEETPGGIRRLFLSSPMIVPDSGGVPLFFGRALVSLLCRMGKSKKRSFTAGPYPGHEEFSVSCKTSKARFTEYEEIKRADRHKQNYAPSYGWMREALSVGRRILAKGMPERLTLPVFLAVAGQDTVVLRRPQEQLFARLPNARQKVYEGAKHEIYGSADPVAFAYFDDLLAFFLEQP